MSNPYHVDKLTEVKVYSVPQDASPATLVVDAGTGTVVLEVLMDTDTNDYLIYDTYTVDGVQKIEAQGCTLRVTPTGDAAFTMISL